MFRFRNLVFFVLMAGIVLLSSCSRRSAVIIGSPNHLPPGQAKKVYGTQSAKPFAPGQQKKKGTTVIVRN